MWEFLTDCWTWRDGWSRRRRRYFVWMLLAPLAVGLILGWAARAAAQDPLAYRASPYLAADETDWGIRAEPSTISVYSTLPVPPEAERADLARLVVCSVLGHPVVRAGYPFRLPTVVEFSVGTEPGLAEARVVVEAVACDST